MDAATPPPLSPPSDATASSRWPKVLGTILLIFGCLGALQPVLGLVGMPMTKSQMQTFASQGAEQQLIDEYLAKLQTQTVISSVALSSIAILLIVGSIFLLKQKPAATPTLISWAILKSIAGVALSLAQAPLTKMQLEIVTSIQEVGDIVQIVSTAATIGLALGIAWMLALPIFVLIWFSRAKIRAEVKGW